MLSNIKEKVVSRDGKYFWSYSGWHFSTISFCHCARLFSIMQWGKPHKEKRTSLVLLFGGNGIVGFQQSVNWPWFCWWHCSSDEIRQAIQLLRNVEIECGKVGPSLNAKTTKAVYLNVKRKEMETIVESWKSQGLKISNTWVAGIDFVF